MKDIFNFCDSEDVKEITEKVAELFGFPAFQFHIIIQGNVKFKNAILKHDLSFYENAINKLNSIPCKRTKLFERAEFQRIVFGESGISSDEVRAICEQMDDMYFH